MIVACSGKSRSNAKLRPETEDVSEPLFSYSVQLLSHNRAEVIRRPAVMVLARTQRLLAYARSWHFSC
jgi:hypothetical protein